MLLVESYGFKYALDAARRFNLDCERAISAAREVFGRELYRLTPLRGSHIQAASSSSPNVQG